MAVNGREGVELACTGVFDLVLMDIQMPIMDGLAATKLIRTDQRFANLPVVAMTAHAMVGDYQKSLDAGMNDHVTKPINPDRLKDVLLKWMPGKPVQGRVSDVATAGALQDNAYIPETLAPFDIQAALRRMGGKRKLLRRTMVNFRNQYAHAASDLRHLIREGKRDEAERLAHSLKGLARTLEAAELGNAAFAVEDALRCGDIPYVEPLIERMEKLLATATIAAASLETDVTLEDAAAIRPR
jgi:two-component system, sensor histidine kinase and response regulator